MCFKEHIRYVCGHASLSILRACPLTTTRASHHICPGSPHRPTYVDWMCPPCHRIVQNRWTEIALYEHRWMHDRGTCGCCLVQFPTDQQPRYLLQQQPVGAGPVSIYATEWVADHAALHRGRHCNCRVQFNPYPGYPLPPSGNPLPGAGAVNSRPTVAFKAKRPATVAAAASDTEEDGTGADIGDHRSRQGPSLPRGWAAQREIPIMGLPIGAGPEGSAVQSSYFELCRLSRPMPTRRNTM